MDQQGPLIGDEAFITEAWRSYLTTGIITGVRQPWFEHPRLRSLLGDTVNVTARLCSQAAAGELLVGRTTQTASGLLLEDFELRQLLLKGKQDAIEAWVVKNT